LNLIKLIVNIYDLFHFDSNEQGKEPVSFTRDKKKKQKKIGDLRERER
jgi:hypothetical protein